VSVQLVGFAINYRVYSSVSGANVRQDKKPEITKLQLQFVKYTHNNTHDTRTVRVIV